MKTKLWVFMLALFLVGAAGTANAQPENEGELSGGSLAAHLGTWKLNEAKSHIAKGATKNHTVIYEKAGDIDTTKVTVDGTAADGSSTHSEWTGKFNGVYYPVSGDPTSTSRMYTRVNKSTLSITGKKDGKVALTGTITVSRDGKSRTVTTSVLNAQGKWVRGTAIYDKQ